METQIRNKVELINGIIALLSKRMPDSLRAKLKVKLAEYVSELETLVS